MRHLKWHLTLAYQDSPLARCTFKTDKTLLTFLMTICNVWHSIMSMSSVFQVVLATNTTRQTLSVWITGRSRDHLPMTEFDNVCLISGHWTAESLRWKGSTLSTVRGGVGYVILCNDIKKVSSVSVRTECSGGFFYQYLEGDVPTSCSVSISKAFIFVLFQWW